MISQVSVVLNRTVTMLLVVSPTSHFANVPFANVLCRSGKKRNERYACIYFVLSAMTQKKCDTYVGNSFYQPLIKQKQLRK